MPHAATGTTDKPARLESGDRLRHRSGQRARATVSGNRDRLRLRRAARGSPGRPPGQPAGAHRPVRDRYAGGGTLRAAGRGAAVRSGRIAPTPGPDRNRRDGSRGRRHADARETESIAAGQPLLTVPAPSPQSRATAQKATERCPRRSCGPPFHRSGLCRPARSFTRRGDAGFSVDSEFSRVTDVERDNAAISNHRVGDVGGSTFELSASLRSHGAPVTRR